MFDRKRRETQFIIHMVQMVLGIFIILMAVMAFISPTEYTSFFSAIFLFFGIIQALNIYTYIQKAGKKQKIRIGLYMLLVISMLVLCILSLLILR